MPCMPARCARSMKSTRSSTMGGEYGITAEEIHLDLHGVVEPAEDINIVPAFFVVAARRVIVDADFVADIAVELGIKLGLENIFEDPELRFFLGFEGVGIVENFAVAIAEDIGGKPAVQAEHAG